MDLLKTYYNISVTRDSDMKLRKDINSEGSVMRHAHTLRRRKCISSGPNAVCHTDGCDKLKHMVFRFMVQSTDFLDVFYGLMLLYQTIIQTCMLTFTLTQLKLCLEMLRTDCGSDNVLTAYIQSFLANSVNAHKHGSSHSNQRIGNYWSHSENFF